jgi:SAM-dependent methyltransferase
MPDAPTITQHYTQGGILDRIMEGVEKLGKSVESVQVDDLAPVDEFHIGGRVATESFLDQLAINQDHHILDVGCGLGGGSRFAALRYGCRVTGVDLTPEYVETGNVLCEWVGLNQRVRLQVDDAASLPHEQDTFDAVYMMHVGMNIADKQSLAGELYRVVRPGGKVGIYDVMQVGEGELQFPVPWASGPDGSSVSPMEEYRSNLEHAGFDIVAERNRREFALEFFAELQAKVASAEGPPPLGLHILMGEEAPVKVRNMIENISRNLVAPIEIIGEKRA